jgi:glycosyltransferase involved in cell wall biosynthesis
LVIDDGSIDGTKGLVEKYMDKDPRIQYFYKENSGQGSARNMGIRLAKGNYVLCLDSDDILLAKMLDCFVAVMDEKDYDIITCKKWMISLSDHAIRNVDGPNTSCILLKKSLFSEFSYYDENDILEDLELDYHWYVLLAQQGKCLNRKNLDVPFVLYMQHSGQISDHGDIARLMRRMRALIQKYKTNGSIPRSWMARNYWELGNFEMFLGNFTLARRHFRISWLLHPSLTAGLLFLISFLGVLNYKRFIYFIKLVRENILFRRNVNRYKIQYPDFYGEVMRDIEGR